MNVEQCHVFWIVSNLPILDEFLHESTLWDQLGETGTNDDVAQNWKNVIHSSARWREQYSGLNVFTTSTSLA